MPTQIAIAIIEQADCFLIGPRPAGVALAELWEFPGGKVEANETTLAAAIRECREETGLEIEVTGTYPTHVQQYDHGEVELHFFRCRSTTEQVPLDPYRWVPRTELANYEFPRGNRNVLKLILNESP